jgi:hypothetical protein
MLAWGAFCDFFGFGSEKTMMNNKIRSVQKLIDPCPAAPQVDYYGNPITPTPPPTATPNVIGTPVGTITPAGTVTPSEQTCTVTIANRTIYGYATAIEALLGKGAPTIDLNGKTNVVVDLRSILNPNIVRGKKEGVSFWFNSGDLNVSSATGNCNLLPTEFYTVAETTTFLERDYGVLLRNEANFAWTATEIFEIYKGVVKTAAAFSMTSASTQPSAALFKQIMTQGDLLPYIVFYKAKGSRGSTQLSGTFTVPDPSTGSSVNVPFTVSVGDGGCAAIQGTGSVTTGSPVPRIIACDSLDISANTEIILGGAAGQANRAFTEYVVVHELGHLFDNRTILGTDRLLNLAFQGLASGNCPAFLINVIKKDDLAPPPQNAAPLKFKTTCVDIVDSGKLAVIGRPNGSFVRGERGWGTGPDSVFTDFQQHPGEVFARDSAELIVEEVAADMFLNWTYRIISNIPLTYLQEVPGNWIGFKNIDWRNNTEKNDQSFPGDARMEWMQIVMKAIFENKGW